MSTEISKDFTAPSALEAINQRINALKEVQSRAPLTDGKFRFNPNYTANAPIDIHRSKDIQQLITIHSYLAPKAAAYERSAELMELETYPAFEWQGYTFAAWDKDIRQRVSIVRYHSELEKLEEAKKQISTMLSSQDRLNLILVSLGLSE